MPRSYPRRAADGPVPLSFGRMVQPDRRSGRRPVSRLDAEGRRQVAPSWESLVERQLREAMEEGAFDGLPYQGERLPMDDDSAAGDWAMAYRMLRNAGAAPPWIEADKDVRRLLERRDAIVSRAPVAPAGTPRPGGARGGRHRGQRRHRPPQRRGADGPTAPPPARVAEELARRRPRRPVTAPHATEPGRRSACAAPRRRDAPADPAHRPRGVAAAYRGLLLDETMSGSRARLSEDRVDLRIERHETWMGELGGEAALFAETAVGPDRVTLVAIYADPLRRGLGLGSAALAAITAAHPDLPIAADVLIGNEAGETFYTARGFVPREPIDEQLGTELVRERRWWLESRPEAALRD